MPFLPRSVGLGSGEVAAPLGPHRATVQDQGWVAAPHSDDERVHLAQQARARPTLKRTAQGRAARLVPACPQATPRRAFAQEPAQGGQHPHGLRWRVSRRRLGRRLAALDHRRDQIQNPRVQSCPISANPRDGHRHGPPVARPTQLRVVVETTSNDGLRPDRRARTSQLPPDNLFHISFIRTLQLLNVRPPASYGVTYNVTAQVISLEGGIDRSRLSTSQRVNGTAR